MDKIWLAHYPKGVPAAIDIGEYASLRDVFDESVAKFAARPAFTCMHLVELIPQQATDPALLDALETFVVTTLGKGVVRAKDTPNFIANRVGIFSVLATMTHTETYKLGFDVVDALTGPAIGRAKSATYRTADVVGLDTLAHEVVRPS